MLALRRIPVGVKKEIAISVVCRLEWSAWLDVDQAAASGYVLTLGWIADVHRQRAGQDDECLLLGVVSMATPPRA